jgi:hypothetical protein
MQYMLVLAAAPEAWAGDQAHDDDGVIDDWDRFTRALADAGVLVGGHGLAGTDTATTVRVRDGARTLTDGPYTDAKEHLIGYYIIDAADLDTAIGWAAKAPNARIGSVEIRPLLSGTSTAEVVGRVTT